MPEPIRLGQMMALLYNPVELEATHHRQVDQARSLRWAGPGWPPADSEAGAVLDALYWGDPSWEPDLYQQEPGDYGLLVTGSVSRSWAIVVDGDGLPPLAFARQWLNLRKLLGEDRRERALTLATVPATELDPIIKGCYAIFAWCQSDRVTGHHA